MRALSLAAVILAVALPCSLAVDAMAGGSKCHPKYEDQKTFMVMLKKNDAGEGMSAFLEKASGEENYVKPSYTVPSQGHPSREYNKPSAGPSWAKAAPKADMDSFVFGLDPSRQTAVYKANAQAKMLAMNQNAVGDLRLSIDEKNAAGKTVGWGSLASIGGSHKAETADDKPEFEHCLDVVFMSDADGLDWEMRKQTAMTLLDLPNPSVKCACDWKEDQSAVYCGCHPHSCKDGAKPEPSSSPNLDEAEGTPSSDKPSDSPCDDAASEDDGEPGADGVRDSKPLPTEPTMTTAQCEEACKKVWGHCGKAEAAMCTVECADNKWIRSKLQCMVGKVKGGAGKCGEETYNSIVSECGMNINTNPVDCCQACTSMFPTCPKQPLPGSEVTTSCIQKCRKMRWYESNVRKMKDAGEAGVFACKQSVLDLQVTRAGLNQDASPANCVETCKAKWMWCPNEAEQDQCETDCARYKWTKAKAACVNKVAICDRYAQTVEFCSVNTGGVIFNDPFNCPCIKGSIEYVRNEREVLTRAAAWQRRYHREVEHMGDKKKSTLITVDGLKLKMPVRPKYLAHSPDVDLCAEEKDTNGGCHASAVCKKTGPSVRECECPKELPDGDPYQAGCAPPNMCLKIDNGGCGPNSYCVATTPGARQCHCNAGFTGDAYDKENGCSNCGLGEHTALGGKGCQKCGVAQYKDVAGQKEPCKQCPGGKTTTGAGSKSADDCVECEEGTFSPAGGQRCARCKLGSTAFLKGSVACAPCGKGKSTATAGATECTDCQPGTHSPTRDLGACERCKVGTYSPIAGADECSKCKDGTVTITEGASRCTPCPANSYAKSGDSSCTKCSVGFESAPGAAVCTWVDACTRNHGGCSPQAACSSVSGVAGNTCKCNAGWSGGGESCEEVKPCELESRGGCHQKAACAHTGPGANTCTCLEGFTGNGRSTCTSIDPCQAAEGNNCHAHASCKHTGPGTHTCTCNAPDYTGDGQACAGVDKCADGTNGGCEGTGINCVKTGANQAKCVCRAGHYPLDSKKCQACFAGSYKTGEGSGSCRQCPAGKHAHADGSAECVTCTERNTISVSGAADCSRCPVGTAPLQDRSVCVLDNKCRSVAGAAPPCGTNAYCVYQGGGATTCVCLAGHEGNADAGCTKTPSPTLRMPELSLPVVTPPATAFPGININIVNGGSGGSGAGDYGTKGEMLKGPSCKADGGECVTEVNCNDRGERGHFSQGGCPATSAGPQVCCFEFGDRLQRSSPNDQSCLDKGGQCMHGEDDSCAIPPFSSAEFLPGKGGCAGPAARRCCAPQTSGGTDSPAKLCITKLGCHPSGAHCSQQPANVVLAPGAPPGTNGAGVLQDVCKCNEGWQGDGHSCAPTDVMQQMREDSANGDEFREKWFNCFSSTVKADCDNRPVLCKWVPAATPQLSKPGCYPNPGAFGRFTQAGLRAQYPAWNKADPDDQEDKMPEQVWVNLYLGALLADIAYWPKKMQMEFLSAKGTGLYGFDMKTYNYYSHESSDSQAYSVEHKDFMFVGFRGSKSATDIVHNLKIWKGSDTSHFGDVHLHKGIMQQARGVADLMGECNKGPRLVGSASWLELNGFFDGSLFDGLKAIGTKIVGMTVASVIGIATPGLDDSADSGTREAQYSGPNCGSVGAPRKPVVMVGHSSGGGAAYLSGLAMHKKGWDIAGIITYGQPRVVKDKRGGLLDTGSATLNCVSQDFRDKVPYLRVLNHGDKAVTMPPSVPFVTDFKHIAHKVPGVCGSDSADGSGVNSIHIRSACKTQRPHPQTMSEYCDKLSGYVPPHALVSGYLPDLYQELLQFHHNIADFHSTGGVNPAVPITPPTVVPEVVTTDGSTEFVGGHEDAYTTLSMSPCSDGKVQLAGNAGRSARFAVNGECVSTALCRANTGVSTPHKVKGGTATGCYSLPVDVQCCVRPSWRMPSNSGGVHPTWV